MTKHRAPGLFSSFITTALFAVGCGEQGLHVTESYRQMALHIQAPDGRMEVPYRSELDADGAFAFEAWVYMLAPTTGVLLNKWAKGTEDKLFVLRNNRIEAAFYTDPTHMSYSAATPSAPSPLEWHHLAVSVDPDRTRIFVDGRLRADVASLHTITNANSPFVIGAPVARPPPDDPRPADVYFSDVRLSSSARYMIDFVPPAHLASDAETIALWHLDEGQGATAKDSGPSGLSGAILGSAKWEAAPARE